MKLNNKTRELMEVIKSFKEEGKAVSISVNREQTMFRYVLEEFNGCYDCYEGRITEYATDKYAFGSLWRKRLAKQDAMNWCKELANSR